MLVASKLASWKLRLRSSWVGGKNNAHAVRKNGGRSRARHSQNGRLVEQLTKRYILSAVSVVEGRVVLLGRSRDVTANADWETETMSRV